MANMATAHVEETDKLIVTSNI